MKLYKKYEIPEAQSFPRSCPIALSCSNFDVLDTRCWLAPGVRADTDLRPFVVVGEHERFAGATAQEAADLAIRAEFFAGAPPNLNPGSPEAVRLGCLCPAGANRHGAGVSTNPDASAKAGWWVSEGCPVHDARGGVNGAAKGNDECA